MELKKFLSIHIFCVLIFVGFLYYVTIFIFLDDLLSLNRSAGKNHFFSSVSWLLFVFLVSLFVFSKTQVVFLLPICLMLKIMKLQIKNPKDLDHHCAWINNCVGHRNYKAFVTLIFYATIASIYSSVILVSDALHKDWNFDGVMPLKIFYVGTGVVIIGLSVTLGTLLGWHIYLTSRNMTTIEYYEGKRAAWLASKSGMNYHHLYDVGAYKNISVVLGPNMLKWLCPTAVSHIKDGLSFPTSREYS
ncbi:unnamed protein product [Withania somnifera]